MADFWKMFWAHRRKGLSGKSAYAAAIVDCGFEPTRKPSRKTPPPVILPKQSLISCYCLNCQKEKRKQILLYGKVVHPVLHPTEQQAADKQLEVVGQATVGIPGENP